LDDHGNIFPENMFHLFRAYTLLVLFIQHLFKEYSLKFLANWDFKGKLVKEVFNFWQGKVTVLVLVVLVKQINQMYLFSS